MADEELTLILRLRDEATKQMKSARAGIVAAGAAIAAAGFTAGKKWDTATKTIVDGTGATGEALAGLQKDYQAVAKYGDGAATVIADLNTHLGLEGEALQMVAEAALKAKVDTNLFGDVASQLGLDAEGAAGFLDQLTVASQGTGVDIDILTRTIGKSSARWQAAGGDMDDLAATVIAAADEFGPSGLRGAMSEIMQEVDKGLLPTVASLESQLGDTTGAVERTYEASKTWRDTLSETKNAALAYIGPAGDMLGVLGSTASGLALAGPQMLKWIKATKFATIAQKAFNLAMKLNPIGLIVTAIALVGLAIYKWRDQIWGFLKGAWNGLIKGLESGYNFIARLVPGMEEVSFASKMSFEPAVEAAAEATVDLARESEAASASLVGGGDSLVSSLGETAKAAEDAAEKIRLSALAVASSELKTFYKMQADTRAEMAKTTRWLQDQHEEAFRVESAQAAASQELNDFYDLQQTTRAELSADSAWLEDLYTTTGTASSAGFLNSMTSTFADAFAGGGGFMGGLQSVMTQGWGKLFVGEGEEAATGFLGKMQSVMGKLGGIPLVGPLLQAFGPALISGIGKLASKVWSGIKSLFGGPDEMEKAGRKAASEARNAIASTLTDGQIAEAAGNMANAVHIAVRDAVLGSGGTLEMAERTAGEMVKLLHTAEKQGTEAVAAAKQAILAILDSVPKEITTTITTVHRDVYEGSGGGSGSSDVFRPSQIDPNRASPSQPAIQVTAVVPRDAVTDAMLQNAPRRQALHGTA